MDSLADILKEELAWYAKGGGRNVRSFLLVNETEQVYAVLIIDTPIRKRSAGIVLLARIVDQQIIIEEDNTDRPLVEGLQVAGIPREQIVLNYLANPEPS